MTTNLGNESWDRTARESQAERVNHKKQLEKYNHDGPDSRIWKSG
jgi:hypothetical protein